MNPTCARLRRALRDGSAEDIFRALVALDLSVDIRGQLELRQEAARWPLLVTVRIGGDEWLKGRTMRVALRRAGRRFLDRGEQ